MAVLLLLLLPSLLHAQGHHVVGDRYVVEGTEDWGAWSLPKRAAIITADGLVMPFRTQREIDPVEDADEYVHRVPDDKLDEFAFDRAWEGGLGLYGNYRISFGGVKNAGANVRDSRNVLDRDPETYWTPASSDTLLNWWIELDLGRAATVTGIVLRCVEPFRRFKVLVSNGSAVGSGISAFDWRQVYSSRSVEEDLVYEIPVSAPLKQMEGEGDVIQYIRIQATDWTDRGPEVSKGEYEVLLPGAQGLVEYFRKTERGGVRPVSEEVYEALPIKERGAIRYYIKPQPNLSEVEVHAVGDNIAVGLLDRGGSVDNPATNQPLGQRSLVDGSFVSSMRLIPSRNRPVQLIVDLGATFWTDELRLIADRRNDYQGGGGSTLSSYQIEASDGTRTSGDQFLWWVLTSDDRLNASVGPWRTKDLFDLLKARYLRLTFLGRSTMFLREVQVYGEGYVPDVTMESPTIDLGPHRAISFVRWEGDTPPGTAIEIQTRTGDRMKEIKRFFDVDGNEVTERRWNRLPGFLQGSVVRAEAPGDDWSDWSAPYAYSGELVRSPTPSRYVEFQVRLLSDDPELFATIRNLSFDTFPPLVHRASGEITPEDATQAGERETFTFFAALSAVPSDLGFDELVLTSPYAPRLSLESVRMAPEEELAEAPMLSSDEVTVVPSGPDSIRIRFSRRLLPVRNEVLAIRFGASILRKGTRFTAYLWNRSLPDTPQEIRPGDATVLTDTQTMTVGVPVDTKVLGRVRAHPNPFTPNGDGINDLLAITFPVFNIYPPKDAPVAILDLQGRVLRRLRGRDVDGLHLVEWDGRDEVGDLVAPGVYLVRVFADPEARDATRAAVGRAVYVAY